MKKYLLSMVCLCLMALFIPAGVRAQAVNEANVTSYSPSNLTAADMNGAMSLTFGGTVPITFANSSEYRVFKVNLEAKVYYEMKSEGFVGVNTYLYTSAGEQYKVDDGDGDYITYSSYLYNDEDGFSLPNAGTYYIVVTSNSISSETKVNTFNFSMKKYGEQYFTDTVTREDSYGENSFCFVPKVTGEYRFKIESAYYPDIYVRRGNGTNASSVQRDAVEYGKKYEVVTVTLKAGLLYSIEVDVNVAEAYTFSMEKSAAADQVTALIGGIGDVSKKSKAAIDAAASAYDALIPAEKKLVTNADVLTAARNSYGNLSKLSTKIKNAKSVGNNNISLTWKKVKAAKGYQITCTYKKNKKNVTKSFNVNKGGITSKVIKLAGAKGKVFVQVRSYTNINGQKCYGAYSSKKKVAVK